jgi:hypothetical protein
MQYHFSGQTSLSAGPNLVSAPVSGEAVIYHIPSGVYYGLNEVGNRVWELLQQTRTFREICRFVVKEYQVEPEQCRRDLAELLADLAKAGLVEVK